MHSIKKNFISILDAHTKYAMYYKPKNKGCIKESWENRQR